MSWYRETFNEDYLTIYQPLLDGERTHQEVQGLLTLAAPPPGARLLDLCCGHGRHALELARLGYEVTGVDLSRHYLDYARKRARGAGLKVRWLRADMRELPYVGEFDLVVNLYNAFGYFDEPEENQRVLEGVQRALKPGGLFFLDLLCPTMVLNDVGQGIVERKSLTLDETVEYDADRHKLLLHHTVHRKKGDPVYYLHSLQLYQPEQVAGMLEQAGFTVEGQWGDFEGGPLHEGGRMITLARRRTALG